jgi:anti-anti-sigma factor
MDIKVERYGQAANLACKGDLNEDSLEVFSKEVDTHLAAGAADLILDLAEVGFIDSAGLECLLGLQDRLAENRGQVTLTNVNENVAKVLEITRLDKTFSIVGDTIAAIRAT